MNWIKLNKKYPLAYKTGGWDGKKSDNILLCTQGKGMVVGVMYEVDFGDRIEREFYDNNDNEITMVKYWAEIDEPF